MSKGIVGKNIMKVSGIVRHNPVTGKPYHLNNYLLDMPRNGDIDAAYSPMKLRRYQAYPLAVEHSTKGEKDIPFKDGEADWDAVVDHMDGERPVISKLHDQTEATGYAGFSGNDRPELANNMVCVEREVLNEISDNSMSEAELGVVGSGGAFPGGWNLGNASGWSHEIVSIGVINKVPYIDIRFYGTSNSSSHDMRFGSTTSVNASQNQTWMSCAYYQIIDDTALPNSFRNDIYGWTSGGGFVEAIIDPISVTDEFKKFTHKGQLQNEDTERVSSHLRFVVTVGNNYDFTIRFGMPQLFQGQYCTLPILTSGSAVTRLAPSPPIPDFIPTTGYIAGWVDMVMDDGHLFGGDVELYVDDDKFKGEIYGEAFEFDIPFTWDDYEREKFGFLLSWSGTNLYLDIVHDTTLTRETEAETITATAGRDLYMGCDDSEENHTSVYFHQLVKGTKETFTDTEAKQLLADLSTGLTDLKPSDL